MQPIPFVSLAGVTRQMYIRVQKRMYFEGHGRGSIAQSSTRCKRIKQIERIMFSL